jgi:transcriptional regulator with XRE-family HTH domain
VNLAYWKEAAGGQPNTYCVQKVEYGQTDPKASTLLKLCAAFEVTLPELLTLDSPTRELAKPERADS